MKSFPLFCLALSSLAFSVSTPITHAQITASFSGGGATGGLVTNQVDAYSGKAGLGWVDAWTTRRAHPVAVVSGSSAAWGTATRLQVSPNIGSSGTDMNVNRTYQGFNDPDFGLSLDLNKPYTIRFDFSIDDLRSFLNTSTNNFYLGQQKTNSVNSVDSTIWFVSGLSGDPSAPANANGSKQGQWNFFNGKRGAATSKYVPTGISLEQGVLYHFAVNLNPEDQTYTISISNGKGGFFESDLLVFSNTSESLATSTMLSFGQNFAAGQSAVYSFSNISITQIPEPSTAYLLLGASTYLGWMGLKKVRGQAPLQ